MKVIESVVDLHKLNPKYHLTINLKDLRVIQIVGGDVLLLGYTDGTNQQYKIKNAESITACYDYLFEKHAEYETSLFEHDSNVDRLSNILTSLESTISCQDEKFDKLVARVDEHMSNLTIESKKRQESMLIEVKDALIEVGEKRLKEVVGPIHVKSDRISTVLDDVYTKLNRAPKFLELGDTE